MLVIRLRRIGRKHDPHYRLVVAEHTAPPQGKFIAEIGHHHPKSKETVIDRETLLSWLDKGAQPSNRVAKLCQKAKLAHKLIVVKHFHGQRKEKRSSIQPAVPLTPPEALEGDTAPEDKPSVPPDKEGKEPKVGIVEGQNKRSSSESTDASDSPGPADLGPGELAEGPEATKVSEATEEEAAP